MISVDPCNGYSCTNGGTKSVSGTSCICSCRSGFSGSSCEGIIYFGERVSYYHCIFKGKMNGCNHYPLSITVTITY